MKKVERIEALEDSEREIKRMLMGPDKMVQPTGTYRGVFMDLAEHHSRLKAVENDVPELIRELAVLAERVEVLESLCRDAGIGRQDRLKSDCSSERAGSSPAPGTDVDGDKAGWKCPECGQDWSGCGCTPEEAGINPEPTLWWWEGQFWVKGRAGIPALGEVYLGRDANRLVPRRARRSTACDSGLRWQVLRPAKTFPATDTRPGLVESGERVPKAGQWFDRGEGTSCQRAACDFVDEKTSKYRCYIPVWEAWKRCGVEDDVSVEDLPAGRQLEELVPQYEAQKARVKWLEDRCRRADDQWEERARVFQGRVMEAEARADRAEYVVSRFEEDTARLVDVVRDLPGAPPGVRLPDSRREAIQEALRPFVVGDGRAVRHEGVDG